MSAAKKSTQAAGSKLLSERKKAQQISIGKRLAARKTAAKPARAKSTPVVPQADPQLHPERRPGWVTWRDLIMVALHAQEETFADIVASVPTGTNWLHVEFKPRAWASEGCPFTLWTKARVYFPVTDCLSEWVGSVSRKPDDHATLHQGVEPSALDSNGG